MRSFVVALAPLAFLACSSKVSSTGAGGSSSAHSASSASSASSSASAGGAPDAFFDDGIISASPTAATSESETHVAVASSGRALAVWTDLAPFAVGYSWSQDRGKTWSAPATAGFTTLGDPVTAVGADGAFYLGGLNGSCTASGCDHGQVLIQRANPGDSTFGAPVDVSPADPTEFYDKPWLMRMSDGAIAVTFAARVGNYPNNVDHIVLARTTDGATWTRRDVQPKDATGVIHGIPHSCTSTASPRAWVTYVDTSSPIGASLRWSDDAGVTWPAANISSAFAAVADAADLQSYDLRCTGEGDDVWLMTGYSKMPATGQLIPPLDKIVVAHSSDGGKTFATKVTLPMSGLGLRPEIFVDGKGTLYVMVYSGTAMGDASGQILLYVSKDKGNTFAAPSVVHAPILFTGDRSLTAWVGDYNGLAADDRDLFITYADNGSKHVHIGFARSPLE